LVLPELGKVRVDSIGSDQGPTVARISLTALGLQDFRVGKCTAWT